MTDGRRKGNQWSLLRLLHSRSHFETSVQCLIVVGGQQQQISNQCSPLNILFTREFINYPFSPVSSHLLLLSTRHPGVGRSYSDVKIGKSRISMATTNKTKFCAKFRELIFKHSWSFTHVSPDGLGFGFACPVPSRPLIQIMCVNILAAFFLPAAAIGSRIWVTV